MSDTILRLNGLADRLLPMLMQWEIQILLLGALVFIIDRFLRKARPAVRYGLWLILLAKIFLPPVFDFPVRGMAIPLAALPIASAQSLPAPPAPDSLVPAASLPSPGGCFLIAWALCSLSLAALAIGKQLRMRALLRNSSPLDPAAAEDAGFAAIRSIRFFRSHASASPFTLGILRPEICLPAGMDSLDPSTRQAILEHEYAHVRRRDPLVLLLQTLGSILHPFNPAVWVMNIRLGRYRELACDAAALRSTRIDPRSYGNALLAHAARRRPPSPAPSLPFFETKRDLARRLTHILNYSEMDMNRLSFVQKLPVAAAALFLGLTLWQCAKTSGPASTNYTDISEPRMVTQADVPPKIRRTEPMDPIAQHLYRADNDPRHRDRNLNELYRIVVDLDAAGTVRYAAASEGASNMLAAAVLDGVRESKWEPARRGGAPVPCRFSLDIRYSRHVPACIEQNPSAPSCDIPPRIVGGETALRNALVLPPEKVGCKGSVTMKVMVLSNGWVCKVQLLSGSDSILAAAAMAAVRRVAWEPGYNNGKPLSWTEVDVPVRFD